MKSKQLQGVCAVTGSQLQAFRQGDRDANRIIRPVVTWWTSATLRSRWLASVDSVEVRLFESAQQATIADQEADLTLSVYQAEKPLTLAECEGKISDKKTLSSIVDLVTTKHAGNNTLESKGALRRSW